LGESFLEKMEINEYVFGKNHGKLAHLQNLTPKIIYGIVIPMFPPACKYNYNLLKYYGQTELCVDVGIDEPFCYKR
jgi:hypothetical protein